MLAVTCESARLSGYVCRVGQSRQGNWLWSQSAGLLSARLALVLMKFFWVSATGGTAPRLRTAKAQRIINILVGGGDVAYRLQRWRGKASRICTLFN